MSVLHPHTVACVCGTSLSVDLADSVNGHRSPAIRRQILDGQLHRCSCQACGRAFTVEKPFYYSDLPRNALFRVAPRGERHTWREASDELSRAARLVAPAAGGHEPHLLRTVFGMDELREKLVAQDEGFDDRLVELLKVHLVHEHPFLLKQPRLRLTLTCAGSDHLSFTATYEHSPQRYRLRLPRQFAEAWAANPAPLQALTAKAHQHDLFNLPDHWVNMWRWSPQPGALAVLKRSATLLREKKPVDLASKAFQDMVAGLPRGSHLPEWAKQDLRTVFEHVKQHGPAALEDDLFEVRFGFELDDDWTANADTEDVDTLWKLLKDLPDANVEGNTKIHALLLNDQGGGLYDPSTNDITIGFATRPDRATFESVVRHEVGHAVHEMNDALITDWLRDEFGWRTYNGLSDAGIDDWMAQLGGWGELTKKQRGEVRNALREALGRGGSWLPGKPAKLPPSHPWNGKTFPARLAFEKSGPRWYQNHSTWHRANGKAFFLNFWYQTLVAVDERTLDMVAQMPDDYAAMSHFEFFAELYALYHDTGNQQRNVIPAGASAWLDRNLGAASVGMPRPAQDRNKEGWETIVRPR